MADFEYININTTAEKIEKMANLETTYTPEAGKIPMYSQADIIRSGTPKTQDDCANKKYVDDAVANIEIPVIDQTYNAESENAQSGKAVAQVINSRIPKVEERDVNNYPKAVVSISDLEMIDGKTYPKDTAYKHLNIDDGYSKDYPTIPDVSLTKGFIATRDSTTGNLWTGAPVDDVDCANKKYVDDALAQSGGGGETWEVISDTTTEFDTPVSQIVINQDTNGNSFSLKKMRVFIDFTVSETYTGGIARALTASSNLMYIVSQSFSAGTVYGYFIDSEVLPMVNNRCQIISHFNENRMSENGNNFNFEYNSGAVDFGIRTEKMTVTTLGYNVSSISNLDFRLGSTGKINKARILIFGVRA